MNETTRPDQVRVEESWRPTTYEVTCPLGSGLVEVVHDGVCAYVEQLQRPQVVEGSRRFATLTRTPDGRTRRFDDQVTGDQEHLARTLLDVFADDDLAETRVAAGRAYLVARERERVAAHLTRLIEARAAIEADVAAAHAFLELLDDVESNPGAQIPSVSNLRATFRGRL